MPGQRLPRGEEAILLVRGAAWKERGRLILDEPKQDEAARALMYAEGISTDLLRGDCGKPGIARRASKALAQTLDDVEAAQRRHRTENEQDGLRGI